MSGLNLAYSDAPNLAPAQPLARAAQERQQDKTVQVNGDWLKKTKDQYLTENESTWQSQTLIWEMIFLFIEGKQLLKRGRYGGGWRTAPLAERTDSPVYSQNLVGFYSENIKSKWTQSNTDVNWRPTSDADDAQGAAKAAQHVHDYYKRKLYTERFRQTEASLAQCGKYARYYYYSEDVKAYGRREKVEPRSVQFGGGYWYCADCGEGGDAADLVGQSPVQPDGASGFQQRYPAGSGGGVRSGQGGAGASLGDDQQPKFNGGGLRPNSGVVEGASGIGQDLSLNASAPFSPGLPNQPAIGTGLEPAGAMPGAAIQPRDVRAEAPTVRPGVAEEYIPDGAGYAGGGNPVAADPMGAPSGVGCPSCGSPNLDIEPPAQAEIEAVTGYEQIELGDFICEPVPAFELKHDLTKTPQDSPFLIRRRRLRVAVLESKWSEIAIKAARREDVGLQAEDDLKRSTYNSGQNIRLNTDGTTGEQTADLIQVWLDPCLYSRCVLKEDLVTVTGQRVEAGTKLIELFPDGMYSAWIEGIEGCVELRNEHHRDYWVGSEYRLRAISSLGTGIEDMIEGQRQYNLIMSIIYTQLRTSAMPATLYDQRLLPNGTSSYLGSLQNIPVEMAALDDRVPISAAVHQLSPQPPTPAHFQYGQNLDIYLQKASRVIDVGFGEAMGRNNSTATAVQETVAQQQGLFGPQLALKAEVDRRGAEIILDLFKKYAIDERYVSLSGKRGEQDGIWLSAADAPADLFAEIANESYLPQTNLERRQRWEAFILNFPGGIIGLAQAVQEKPAMVESLAEMYDVDLGDEDYTAAAELFQERLAQMKAALPMLQVMAQQMPPTQMQVDEMTGEVMEVPVDPMAEAGKFLVGILQPPIEMEELGQLSSLIRAQSWLTEDDGKKAPPELRAGVKAMMPLYVQGLVQQGQIKAMIGMAGQPVVEEPGQGGAPQSGGGKPKPKDGGSGRPSPKPKKQGTTV